VPALRRSRIWLLAFLAATTTVHGGDYRAPLMAKAPAIDGKIEATEWHLAAGFDGLAFNGQLDRRRARAFVGATKTHLYLAIASQLPDDGPLKAQVAKDTVKVVFDDSIEVWIDPTPGSEHGQTFQMLSSPVGRVGYKHHARGREAEKPTWRGNWQVANGFHKGAWHVEVAVPIADVAPGRTADQGAWGINLCRNWKEPWAFSSIGGGAYAPSDHFVFAPDALAVHHESRADAFIGQLHHVLVLHNPTGKPITVNGRLEITRDAMPALRQSETLTIAPGGTQELAIRAKDEATRKYQLAAKVTSPDGRTVHYSRSFGWQAGKSWRWVTAKKKVLPIDFQFAYYPYANRMRVLIDTSNLRHDAVLEELVCSVRKRGVAKALRTVTFARGEATSDDEVPGIIVQPDRAKARALGFEPHQITEATLLAATRWRPEAAQIHEDGSVVIDAIDTDRARKLLPALMDFPVFGPGGRVARLRELAVFHEAVTVGTPIPTPGARKTAEFSLPPLHGSYDVAVRAKGVSVPEGELVKELDRTVYDWERSGLGTSTRVYPPFTPIKVEGKKVATVLREHTMNDFGLWQQVAAKGKPLLAAPARFVAQADGGAVTLKTSPLHFSKAEPHRVVAHAAFEGGPVHGLALCQWDYDGVMRVDLLLGATAKKLNALRLEIPLKDEMAPMIHAMGDGIRNTVYIRVPKGEGVVWDASKVQVNDFPPNWCSYIYVGGPVRGLCWFAENDNGWSWDREKPNLDLVRKGDQLILRVHFINKPTAIKQPRVITFGLLAAPVKPRLGNWRYAWKRENYTLLGTDINWLARGNCGSVYPAAKDMYLWQMLRRGNREELSRQEIQKVIARGRKYFEPYGPDYVERFERHVWHNLRARRGKKMVFYYNRASCQLFPEFQTFQDEWCLTDYRTVGKGNGVGEIKLVPSPSYIDHALWWYGKSFDVAGNQGVYWDNMYLRASYNTAMTAAYRREDGSTMPSNGIWGLRELVRRTFVYMNERGMRPITMAHMTSTGILPILSFCTVQYDWEWKYSQGDFQYRFPREYIQLVSTGELAGAWPVLLGDHGKLARDEWTQRTFAGVCLVHELDGWGGGKAWTTSIASSRRLASRSTATGTTARSR